MSLRAKRSNLGLKSDCFVATLLAMTIWITPQAVAAPTKPFDHSLWDQFLKQYVNEEGEVNYAAVQKDPSLMEQYLKQLQKIDWMEAKEWPREEMMALWLNAYHAALIKNVLKYYPLKNVHEAPGFWEEDIIDIGDQLFGLNEIRTESLLGGYRDAKMHTALSYAAKSGPKLSREAFTGLTVEGQLFQAARAFVNDPVRNQIVPGEKAIHLSKIFEWYAGDFVSNFEVLENDRGLEPQDFALLSFLVYYLEDEEKVRYLEEENYKIKYLKFDWTLNDWKP